MSGSRGGGAVPTRSTGTEAAGESAGVTAGGAVAGATGGGGAQAGMLGSTEALMTAATTMVVSAAFLPPALMVAFQFKLAAGKPQNIMKAAYAFDNAADDLQKAAAELCELVASIPQQAWSLDDRTKYESHVHEYSLQIDYLHNYLMAVSITLTILAWALFSYAVFATGIGTYLVALAAAAVFLPQYPACLALAGTALTVTWVATGILGTAGVMAAMGLSGGASFTTDTQELHGNQFANAAFEKALANGAKSGGLNLLQNAANGALSFVNRADAPVTPLDQQGKPVKLPGGIPLKEVDLDADRNKDGVWSVGGGAKFAAGPAEHEVGTHHKWDSDGKYQGGDAEYKAKWSVDPTDTHNAVAGGKAEWKPGGDIRPDGGSVTGGYENARTGDKLGVEGGRKDGNWEGKVGGTGRSGSVEHSGSTEASKEPVDETPPWDR